MLCFPFSRCASPPDLTRNTPTPPTVDTRLELGVVSNYHPEEILHALDEISQRVEMLRHSIIGQQQAAQAKSARGGPNADIAVILNQRRAQNKRKRRLLSQKITNRLLLLTVFWQVGPTQPARCGSEGSEKKRGEQRGRDEEGAEMKKHRGPTTACTWGKEPRLSM